MNFDRPAPMHTSFPSGPPLRDFMADVRRILVQEPGFSGLGGHGTEDSLAHGRHRQTSIGLDGRTIDFRESD
jgi:hypothetical protein